MLTRRNLGSSGLLEEESSTKLDLARISTPGYQSLRLAEIGASSIHAILSAEIGCVEDVEQLDEQPDAPRAAESEELRHAKIQQARPVTSGGVDRILLTGHG